MPTLEKEIHLPRYNELPDIELYADQVITYLNNHLVLFNTGGITRTMINNYVKQGIVSSPIKKKYNRNHLAYLLVVCILKNVFSISEICEMIHYQKSTYPTAKSYDMFCEEMELAISKVFHVEMMDMGESQTYEVRLMKLVVTAVANKLYMQQVIEERVAHLNSLKD
ncbi:MAG: DUF1836 domain-containing protein [Erysipelotrichales bacterium]|nr:DUF1836 domain-containing protein [Erysipelotrichales bacterium]